MNLKSLTPQAWTIIALFAAFGFAVDFLCNAIIKINMLAVYGPAYVVIAITFASKMHESRWAQHTGLAVTAFLCTAFAAHLAFAGRQETYIYQMTLASAESPIAFQSSLWPDTLVVSSDKLQQHLKQNPPTTAIDVVANAVTDYGCIRSFAVSTIYGIDVMYDRSASWTFRKDHSVSVIAAPTATPAVITTPTGLQHGVAEDKFTSGPPAHGPGSEDQVFPWCPRRQG